MLHHYIPISISVNWCLAALSSGASSLTGVFNLVVEALKPIILLIGLIAFLEIVDDQGDTLDQDTPV